MYVAKQKDMSSSKISNRIKQSFGAKVKGTTKVARFLLLDSLSDWNHSPNVVHVEQVITDETRVEEVLWNFSRLKGDERITLKQNPNFYRGLPKSAHTYGVDFSTEPIENFRHGTEFFVLTDKRSRVFLDTGDKRRVFGNFWIPDVAIIFKDIQGRLEGEQTVAADIRGTPHLWLREELSVSTGIPPPLRSSTINPVNTCELRPVITNPVRDRVFEDWRQLVHDTLHSPNISIYINTKGTPPESQANWVLSFPTSPTPDPDSQELRKGVARQDPGTRVASGESSSGGRINLTPPDVI